MSGETEIHVVGNLTSDPELRYTQNGLAVANFTVASTPRTFNRQTGEFEDGEALFLRASVWREIAEHVAATLTKGARVVVIGNLKQKSYETKEGEKRTSMELEVTEIGPSLRYATAQVVKSQPQNQNQRQNQGQRQPQAQPQGAVDQGYGQPQNGYPPQQGQNVGYGQPQGQQPPQYQQPPQGQQQPAQGQPQQGYAQPPQQAQQPAQPQQDPWANNAGAGYNDETPF